MKENGEDHFDFVHHNVSACKMNVGKLECTKFGKVGLNNHVSLSHSQKLANGSPMIKDSYEKTFGYHLTWNFVSHVQERSILSKSDLGHFNEVCGHGHQRCGFHFGKSC